MGSRTRGIGDRPSLQRNPVHQGLCLLLVQDCGRLTSKHHWLVIACDSCDSVVDLDLRVKPRDPEALFGWRCVMCNVRAAMGMAARASLRWRDIPRLKISHRLFAARCVAALDDP